MIISKTYAMLPVKKLREEGSVTLSGKSGDGRKKVVAMTEASRERYEARIRRVTWAEDAAMAELLSAEQGRAWSCRAASQTA